MEADTEVGVRAPELLTKKTTILLSPAQHAQLTALAELEGRSLGDLMRSACEKLYGLVSPDERPAAVAALEGICSYDTDFDRVDGLRRIEPSDSVSR